MDTQAFLARLDAGDDPSGESGCLWSFALAEVGQVLPSRPQLLGWLTELRRALGLRGFTAPLEAGQVLGLGLASLILLAARLEAAGALAARRLDTLARPAIPPRLPAACAGLNLSPRLLPIPRAVLAG